MKNDVEQLGVQIQYIHIIEMLMPLSKWVQNTNITVEDVF